MSVRRSGRAQAGALLSVVMVIVLASCSSIPRAQTINRHRAVRDATQQTTNATLRTVGGIGPLVTATSDEPSTRGLARVIPTAGLSTVTDLVAFYDRHRGAHVVPALRHAVTAMVARQLPALMIRIVQDGSSRDEAGLLRLFRDLGQNERAARTLIAALRAAMPHWMAAAIAAHTQASPS